MVCLCLSLTQKKRVPVTIRYSEDSGLKPYYLTVAKRVKDQYPDVLIERIELSDNGAGDGSSDPSTGYSPGTFEVAVDGKIVVRSKRTQTGSIFVSMNEMDAAIARARKRRRPSTVYGELGAAVIVGGRGGDDQDGFNRSKLEHLKQKAMELEGKDNRGRRANRKEV